MAVGAVEGLLKKTNTKPEEIDLVILATVTPDYPFPATANILCDKVGMKNAWGYDLIAACSGFIYALSVADQFIKSGMYKNVLVVGSEVQSSGLDLTTRGRNVAVIFGDVLDIFPRQS